MLLLHSHLQHLTVKSNILLSLSCLGPFNSHGISNMLLHCVHIDCVCVWQRRASSSIVFILSCGALAFIAAAATASVVFVFIENVTCVCETVCGFQCCALFFFFFVYSKYTKVKRISNVVEHSTQAQAQAQQWQRRVTR